MSYVTLKKEEVLSLCDTRLRRLSERADEIEERIWIKRIAAFRSKLWSRWFRSDWTEKQIKTWWFQQDFLSLYSHPSRHCSVCSNMLAVCGTEATEICLHIDDLLTLTERF